jgi:hypothetical protein
MLILCIILHQKDKTNNQKVSSLLNSVFGVIAFFSRIAGPCTRCDRDERASGLQSEIMIRTNLPAAHRGLMRGR